MHPGIDKLSDVFTNQLETDQDQPACPVHVRWQNILISWPQTRKRKICDDMTDVYLSAYDDDDFTRILHAYDLACLQVHFFVHLQMAGNGMLHIIVYNMNNAVYWRNKLLDKFRTIKPKKNKKSKSKVDQNVKLQHNWIH